MKAIQAEQLGSPEVLHYSEVADPTPASGEVLIEVGAAGVNYADTMQRRGIYPNGPSPPFIPGLEVAGRVVALGDGVDDVKEGHRVMALTLGGGYAELVSVPVEATLSAPEGFSIEEAATFPIVFLTAYFALLPQGRVQFGESVLIHAAGGGVGTAAVQLAKSLGARVFATASSDEKLQRVKELGADEVINYAKQDFADVVRERTDGRGVDVVLEMVGGEVFEKSIDALAPFGRLVTYGVASGRISSVNAAQIILKNITVTGVNLNLIAFDIERLGNGVVELMKLVRSSRIKPVIGHTFELSQAAEAHRLLESRQSYGKIVLRPDSQ